MLINPAALVLMNIRWRQAKCGNETCTLPGARHPVVIFYSDIL